jgi:hypothetical protein
MQNKILQLINSLVQAPAIIFNFVKPWRAWLRLPRSVPWAAINNFEF